MAKKISVSSVPILGKALEHYGAALFHAAGYFVETNLEEMDVEAVLELDFVATDYEGVGPATVLGEAKSGAWGYSDLFKLAGWMRYLGIEPGVIVCPGETIKRDPEKLQERAEILSVSILDLGDFSDALDRFNSLGYRQIAPEGEESVAIWRYSLWVETVILHKLKATSKGNKTNRGLQEALHYRRLINDELLFEPNIYRRLHDLYDAYKDHPKLTLGICRELEGEPFDPDSTGQCSTLNEALREGRHIAAQASLYLEHRARLAVMKAAVDLTLESDGDPWGKAADSTIGDLLLLLLPASFQDGITNLMDDPYFRYYPKFWQNYLWTWGGFYLTDQLDREYAQLAEETGVPPASVPEALHAFDRLFPLTGGWHWSVSSASWRQVKMMPWGFRGVGAARRLNRSGHTQYYELGFDDMTGRDLAKWHNHFIDLLHEAEGLLS